MADKSNLPVYYVGLVPNSIKYANKNTYAPAVVPLLSGHGYDEELAGEFYSKLVFKLNSEGEFIGYPDKPVGRWKAGWPDNEINESLLSPPSLNGAPASAHSKGGRRRAKASRRHSTRRAKARRRHITRHR
jgi:hypothetical protein